MPKIIVSSLEKLEEVFRLHEPRFAISILDAKDETPACLKALPADRHLALGGGDCDKKNDAECWRPDIVEFATHWAASGENIVVNCHRGVARSMALAYILICVKEEGACEFKIAERLRKAAPHADPNLLMVSKADEALGRDDRMVAAMLDMCPCSSTVAAPVVVLPVA
ncbi:hypothetical protein PUV54_10290 [Hyphococcus flavus]|uniref:Tyrosine specific protein phosphatases domain-containing protein n=1 Tax=Hyphococcus flavus TaxID=1866326 RepID=A0AAE9ZD83_9PROT|nr:hypothetical protein [Hyphococcus flavus]WDI30347.1 hypothetical protein PUV54_10290 [Hyphococcus flavus]